MLLFLHDTICELIKGQGGRARDECATCLPASEQGIDWPALRWLADRLTSTRVSIQSADLDADKLETFGHGLLARLDFGHCTRAVCTERPRSMIYPNRSFIVSL